MRHFLLFSLLLSVSVLVVSLFCYVYTLTNPSTLRIDIIPTNAYIVPWMRPNPSIEELKMYSADSQPWNIDDVMADALKLNITFTIDALKRTIPSIVYLGHDSEYLYIGGRFVGMYRNPTSHGTVAYPNFFWVLFDVANDGILTFPESGTSIGVALFENGGKVWAAEDLVFLEPSYWELAENVCFPHGAPPDAVRNVDAEYDESTGTLIIIFSRYLRQPSSSEINKFQMKRGERWTVGFLFELGYAKEDFISPDFTATWPINTHHHPSNDSSWWPKLVIDLTNPPPQFK